MPACDAVALLERVEFEFDTHIHEWATCDFVCSRVLFPLTIAFPAVTVPRVVSYCHAASIWRQRAAAVTWVRHGRSGVHTDSCLEVAEHLVQSSERFVQVCLRPRSITPHCAVLGDTALVRAPRSQLGNGWMLREVWRAHPARVKAFIVAHVSSFSREGLRYAVEKMPKAEAAELLALQLEENERKKRALNDGGAAPPAAKRARGARGGVA